MLVIKARMASDNRIANLDYCVRGADSRYCCGYNPKLNQRLKIESMAYRMIASSIFYRCNPLQSRLDFLWFEHIVYASFVC